MNREIQTDTDGYSIYRLASGRFAAVAPDGTAERIIKAPTMRTAWMVLRTHQEAQRACAEVEARDACAEARALAAMLAEESLLDARQTALAAEVMADNWD